jgi:hypothetical protein
LYDFETQIALAGIYASKFNVASFGEINLQHYGRILNPEFPDLTVIREKLKNKNIPKFFSVSQVPEYFCKKCGHLHLFDMDLVECLICDEKIDFSKTNLFRLDLVYTQVSKFLIEKIKEQLKNANYTLEKQDAEYLVIKNSKGVKIGIKFCFNPRVEDYYFLLGKSGEDKCVLNIILAGNLNQQLSLWGQTNPSFLFFGISEFFKDNYFDEIINSKVNALETNNILNNKFEFEKIELLCLDTKEKINLIYDSIIKLALHKGEGDVKKQGDDFEDLVLTLLNWTIFNAVPYGNKNAPDGAITVNRSSGKSIVIPFDVKSYGGDYDSTLDLNPYYGQFGKYISAFKSEEIASKFDSPAFIVFAYDFDSNNKYQNDKLLDMESKFGVNFVFFPLKSLIYLTKKKFENKIYYIKKEEIMRFFIGKRYITEEHIDELFNEMIKWQEKYELPNVKLIRQLVEDIAF